MKKSVYVATYAGMDVLLNRTDGALAVCGKVIAENIDTIEKKPFFMFIPDRDPISLLLPVTILIENFARTTKSHKCRVAL
jgi:hypothetical protein